MILNQFKKFICFIFLIIPNYVLPVICCQNPIEKCKVAIVIEKKVYYQDGFLYAEGFKGFGKIEVYTLLGKKITEISSYSLSEFKYPFYLEKNNMYIIRVITNEFVETFKIISY
tara:strand:+ start:16873 stop:17214 length:342 start_codon:yes stop_codon:yes gene_type:complete